MNKILLAAFLVSLIFHLLLFVFVASRGGKERASTSIVISRVELDSAGEKEKTLEKSPKIEESSLVVSVPKEIPISPSVSVPVKAPHVEYEEKFTVKINSSVLPPASPVEGKKNASDQAKVDVPPAVENSVNVRYPKRARERGEEGDVTLEIEITSEGAVSGVKVEKSSSFPDIDKAAIQAVNSARFIPARAQGVNVTSRVRLTLSFRLR
jgi:protein TonB